MAVCRREIERALSGLLKYAYTLSRDSEAAGELVQETVLKALSTNTQPENAEDFRPWLFTILRNAHIDHVRRIRRHIDRHETVDDIDDLPAFVGHVEDTVINQLSVRQAVMHLPEAHRDILALVDMAGFSYAEASAALGIPKGTVMSRLSRARRAMLVEIGGGKVHSLETAREKKKASAGK
ncbi:MAG TPA: RNA polymerase sigma factor [Rhodobacteraceae bacterium]|nr:RNA polymerase sigma factor [Paracoccaceae bacterium]